MQKIQLLAVAFLFPAAAQAQTFSVLSNFDYTHGSVPAAIHGVTFVQGPDGNFYGATGGGGAFGGCGTIYQLTPTGTLTTLHSFNYTVDGCNANSGLILASDGNLYGATQFTIFKTTLAGAFTLLYTSTGNAPTALNGLIQASDGNFYGTSSHGGTGSQGTVFKMTPSGVVTVLINFPDSKIGTSPQGPLIQASDGNLYGTTSGGASGQGTVFKMSLSGTFTSVHTFCTSNTNPCPDGGSPFSGLVQASDGNLYGTTQQGGVSNTGIIFKLTLGGTISTLYSFCPHNLPCPDGDQSQGALIQASDGYLYGTTANYGANNLSGTLFRISTSGAFATLYQFCSQPGCADGATPQGALVQASNGIIYGATNGGGAGTFGVIFALQPPPVPAYTCTNTTPPTISSIDSASAYGGYPYFASGSWLEIKGTNLADLKDPRLATGSGQWAPSDFNGPNAPTNLDGISVSINGKPAYVWYISPGQLNVQAPEDTTTGNVNITATNCNATSSTTQFTRRALAPGLLAPSNYTSNGTQYLVATFQSDGAYVLNTALGASFGLKSRPAKTGDLIIAYGIGFGDVTPSFLPGTIVSQANQLINPLTFTFGTTPAQLTYSGLAGSFVGLYEFYFTVPSGLPNSDVKLTVSQNGAALPQTFFLTIQN